MANHSITASSADDLAILTDLTACLWHTASLTSTELARIEAEAARHPRTSIHVKTCQRLEVYSVSRCTCDAPTRLIGSDALTHLASVAAGLHSVVLGEEQVMGQVRTALNNAPASLRAVGDVAIAAARELRRTNQFNNHSGHLLDRGLAMAGLNASGSMLILGPGHVGRLIAQRASEQGFDPITIAGRRIPNGTWLEEGGFHFQQLTDLRESEPVDVIVGCLGSGAGSLDVASELPEVRSLVLDLGTPRNFRGNATTPLLDIATLLSAGQHHDRERREKLFARLHQSVERRIEMARTTRKSAAGAVRASVESIRRRECDRIKLHHPDISDETIEAITRSLVNQIFHLPTERLKQLDDPELGDQIAALFSHDQQRTHRPDRGGHE